MAVRDDLLARRWLVGVELFNARWGAGLKQTDTARALNVSQGAVSHYEKGKYVPERPQLLAMMSLYGRPLDEALRLADFAELPDTPSWLAPWEQVISGFMRPYLGLEGFASTIFQYAPAVIPALLQTPAYAAAVTAPSVRVRADQEKRLVELRLARQQRILEGDLHLTAVIEESVLGRNIGGPVVMAEQYKHLMSMAGRPNVHLQIIPASVGLHDGIEGRFVVVHFETEDHQRVAGPVAYIEIPGDAVYKTRQDHVADYTGNADLISAAAWTQDESIKAIGSRLAA